MENDMNNFKVGDYVYYFDGKDTYPCEVVTVKKRVKIETGETCGWSAWVNASSLEHQTEYIQGLV